MNVMELWLSYQQWDLLILRKFIATANGIFRAFPGTVYTDKDGSFVSFDPRDQSWYSRAFNQQNKIVFSFGREDFGGSFIITMSTAIYEEQQRYLSDGDDRIAGVVGVDILANRFLFKLNEYYSYICNENQYQCYIVDSNGYYFSTQVDVCIISHKYIIFTLT